ncbi:type II secretion system F family protein [Asticcacaulis tiandongensis]|uniref:type II secretion system F family protein n=1 Tax=Asticcacaulis tiandongensis TaxID=2565365 RepID=UPI001FE65B68|nr:type II secretion system F family protein [Asticcacaulis tiandongensis]
MAETAYTYKAVDEAGRTKRGVLHARDEADAFARLRGQRLSPVSLKAQKQTGASASLSERFRLTGGRAGVSAAGLETFLLNLSVLLRSGADIRTALQVLDDGGGGLKAVSGRILGGAGVEAALTPVFPAHLRHLGALIGAGEARGDLPAGLEAAAQVLTSRRLIRQQLLEALSYPAFVFVTAIVAMAVILLVVVPAIAPLLSESGQSVPVYFQLVIALSEALQAGWVYLLTGLAITTVLLILGWRYGSVRPVLERWWLDGPLSAISRNLVYGGYARALGESLAGGAGMTEALRLSHKTVGLAPARERLDLVLTAVRQGQHLSEALRSVKGFPTAVLKLTEVGEASGQLGPMLSRAGEHAEAQALQRIARLSKVLGPVLILGLGLMIAALMGGVLTALTDIGSVAGA